MQAENFAIWLYGSWARGDADEQSDVDLLIVRDAALPIVEADHLYGKSATEYTWGQIYSMAEYGSLFLHHLRLEAHPLLEDDSARGRLRLLLDNVPPYTRAVQDVSAYRQAIAESQEAVLNGSSLSFELGVVATTLRHAAILGCYLRGHPTFGRYQALEKYASLAALDRWPQKRVRWLMNWKLHAERRAWEGAIGNYDVSDMAVYLDAKVLLAFVERDACETV